MKHAILKIISYLALSGTIVPSLLVFFGDLDLQMNKNIMAFSMVIWFATAPFWINKKVSPDTEE
ncbi:MAG: hypothetical protein HC819_03655 [Cyclobacteriaceae bacterium]|nr:hypothetical protein [Cyclobacteriaceae bacterium]